MARQTPVRLNADAIGAPAAFADADGNTAVSIAAAGGVSVGKAGGALGFFQASGATIQTVPLTTPTVQNVIDALVAYGLIIQSD